MEEQKILTRQEQKAENTWNMQDLYANEELFSEDGEKLEKMMEEFASYKGTLAEGAEQMRKVFVPWLGSRP